MGRMEPFTFALPRPQRQELAVYAERQGVTVGECLRRIIADHFARLREEQA